MIKRAKPCTCTRSTGGDSRGLSALCGCGSSCLRSFCSKLGDCRAMSSRKAGNHIFNSDNSGARVGNP